MRQSVEDCHTRFMQQASWTHDLRQYLYTRAKIKDTRRVLDVGCGSGALLGELQTHSQLAFGVDINLTHAKMARRNSPATAALLTCADGQSLPYPTGTFDMTLCHFLLLWVADPAAVVAEMARVTRPEGPILALAEPDYGGRIDYPMELSTLGALQNEALQQQGADPYIGRKLAAIFHQAGLKNVETGVLGGQWRAAPISDDAWELEWDILENDLKQLPKAHSHVKLSALHKIESQARQQGERVLFVPTFWAWGICGPSGINGKNIEFVKNFHVKISK